MKFTVLGSYLSYYKGYKDRGYTKMMYNNAILNEKLKLVVMVALLPC